MRGGPSVGVDLHNCVLDLRRPVLIDLSGAEPVLDLRARVEPIVVPELSLRDVRRRTVDAVGAAVLIILTVPLFLTLLAAVRLSIGGPAIATLPGIDRRGRGFLCLGFQTQRQGRGVTRLGAVLDGTRLAQLPRLWNALVGDVRLGQVFAR